MKALDWRWFALAALLVIAPRLAVFGPNENVYGDSVIRTELGMRWAQDPHWISSWKDGTFQFGPLHIYLTGIAWKLWPLKEHAGRVVSLLLGIASAVPLFLLTRRLFDARAALWAVAGFGLWGMHWNVSATAASEAVGLFTQLVALAALARAFDVPKPLPSLLGAAVALQAACATRYDAWLLLPVLALLVWQRLGFKRAFLFGLFCVPFPLLWLIGNQLYAGDALGPIKNISEFHRDWMGDGLARNGELLTRVMGLFFWVGAALFTLSPLVGALGLTGMVQAWRTRRDVRWLLWTALIPTAYFTVRSAVLLDFVPLARFTVNQVVLVLPFVAIGFDVASRELGAAGKRAVAGATWSMAVLLPLFLIAFTTGRTGKYEDALRPVSPITQNAPPVRVAAKQISKLRALDGAVLLDSHAGYLDLQLAFYAGLPDARVLRYRYKPNQLAPPPDDVRWIVLADRGGLVSTEGFSRTADAIAWGERRFVLVPGLVPPFSLYERRPPAGAAR